MPSTVFLPTPLNLASWSRLVTVMILCTSSSDGLS